MKNLIKKYWFLVAVVIANLFTFIFYPQTGITALSFTGKKLSQLPVYAHADFCLVKLLFSRGCTVCAHHKTRRQCLCTTGGHLLNTVRKRYQNSLKNRGAFGRCWPSRPVFFIVRLAIMPHTALKIFPCLHVALLFRNKVKNKTTYYSNCQRNSKHERPYNYGCRTKVKLEISHMNYCANQFN